MARILPGPGRPRTSDAHAGLVEAVGAPLTGASWQRCRTHHAANLMAVTPKSSWPWVKALLRSMYEQPDADAVDAQSNRVIEALTEKLPDVAAHLESARPDIHAFTTFPKDVWRQIWSNNPNELQALGQGTTPPSRAVGCSVLSHAYGVAEFYGRRECRSDDTSAATWNDLLDEEIQRLDTRQHDVSPLSWLVLL